jgi:(S)-sulfolactate dehydrogenase
MADILISEFIDEAALADLRGDFDVDIDPELWSKRDELVARVADVRALIVRNRTRVDRAVIDAGKRLVVIGRLGVGLDNIDVGHARAKGVEVAAAIGSNAVSVAEYVIAMGMVLLRGIAYRASADVAAGKWPREAAGRGVELAGKRLGIVGLGSIGQVVAQRAAAMGMVVSAFDDYVPAGSPAWADIKRFSLDELLASSDVVTLHCPLNEETRGLIGVAALKRMKAGAILINSARGGIVDEIALADALRAGHLGGAALDTFEPEPIAPELAAKLAGIPNLMLTPHIAGVTAEANARASMMTAQNVRRALAKR